MRGLFSLAAASLAVFTFSVLFFCSRFIPAMTGERNLHQPQLAPTTALSRLPPNSVPTSCRNRCGDWASSNKSCYCDPYCLHLKDCCSDYKSRCHANHGVSLAPTTLSWTGCSSRCGERWVPLYNCSCDYTLCMADKRLCCSNYYEVCPIVATRTPTKPDFCTDCDFERIHDTSACWSTMSYSEDSDSLSYTELNRGMLTEGNASVSFVEGQRVEVEQMCLMNSDCAGYSCWDPSKYFHKADKSMCGSSDPRVYAKFQVCSRVRHAVPTVHLNDAPRTYLFKKRCHCATPSPLTAPVIQTVAPSAVPSAVPQQPQPCACTTIVQCGCAVVTANVPVVCKASTAAAAICAKRTPTTAHHVLRLPALGKPLSTSVIDRLSEHARGHTKTDTEAAKMLRKKINDRLSVDVVDADDAVDDAGSYSKLKDKIQARFEAKIKGKKH